MDCYLKGIYKILFVDSPQITVEEFGFLTGYTVSRAWIDKSVAKSFDLPVIYPSWYPDTEYFIEIFCSQGWKDSRILRIMLGVWIDN